jgi:hypothetical protein
MRFLCRPRRLQFGGGHLQLRPALGILIGTDHLANLNCGHAVSAGSPAALRDLDEQALQVEQICRSNPHATQLDRRSIIAEHLEKRTGDGGLRAIAPLLCKEAGGGHRLHQPEGFITQEVEAHDVR